MDPVAASEVLKPSRIVNELVGDRNRLNTERVAAAERLTVCQYTRLDWLIAQAKRLFPDEMISFHWIDGEFDGSVEGHLEPCPDPMEIVARVLPQE